MKTLKYLLTLMMVILPVLAAMERPVDNIEPLTLSSVHVSPKANFTIAFEMIQQHEGYYSFDRYDRGGETYAGITRRWNADWYGWRYIDAHKKKLGRKWTLPSNYHVPEADHWVLDYYLDIWVDEGFYQLQDQRLANYIFDFRINAGRGAKLTQQVLRSIGHDSLIVDNRIGPSTIDAINNSDPILLISELQIRRKTLYYNIVARDRSQQRYLRHWLYRANKDFNEI